jgi:hypothetical protein
MTEPRRPAGSPLFGDLPDVNVWLAMAVTQHPHHEAAANYWKELAGKRIWFCRVTMLGLVRLLAQPKVMGDHALTLPEALDAYHRFASLPEIGFHAEPANCAAELERRLSADLPARLLTDAYLAAFAESAGLRLVTFDKDFERFQGLDRLRLPTAGH